jgi:NADH dehydrogenase FAD-containing subunit
MTHRVVVLGAGYAGFPAAKRLARQVDPASVEVILVNPTDTFLERPRLHQLATGQQLRTIRLADLLAGCAVRLRIGRVTSIDPDARCLTLADASTVEYDTLVYALGSTGDLDTVPGIREHASGFTGAAAAHRLHHQLSTLDGGRLVVCGGGLTGIESAAEFAESYPGFSVELVTAGRVGGWLSPKGQRYLAKSFRRLNVQVRENARVAEIRADQLVLSDGATVPFTVCLWAGGFIVPTLARDSGLKVDGAGRILTDRTLRSLSHPEIYAIGDAAAVPGPWGDALAMGCRTGGFTAPQAADAIAARLAGKGRSYNS